MLSICVTIKNRSRLMVDGRELLLFPRCVESVARAARDGIDCELVVADWGSDDWPYHEWLEQAAHPVPVRLVQVAGTFSRGRGRNCAAAAATGETLFFLDADCLVSANMLHAGLGHTRDGKAFFPILFSFADPEHKEGWWRDTGYGICMMPAAVFRRTSGWPEYVHWGYEDDDFYTAVSAVAGVVREQSPGSFHQWHPNDVGWKNRFGATSNFEELAIARYRAFGADLFRAIPTHSEILIAGESSFQKKALQEFRVHSFLEREGEYWGNPADDGEALAELERMRSAGAGYIVFPQSEAWWLEHYTQFSRHLRGINRCVVASDRFTVFDLTGSGTD